MDWLTFWVRAIEALAWPTVVGFVLWKGRSRIELLLGRLQNLEGWGAKATFAEKLDKLPNVPSEIKGGTAANEAELEIKLAMISPIQMVQTSWEKIESAMKAAMDKKGWDMPNPSASRPPPFHSIMAFIAKDLGLSDKEIRTLTGLSNLNFSTLDPEHGFKIKPEDALRYKSLADDLVNKIRERAEI